MLLGALLVCTGGPFINPLFLLLCSCQGIPLGDKGETLAVMGMEMTKRAFLQLIADNVRVPLWRLTITNITATNVYLWRQAGCSLRKCIGLCSVRVAMVIQDIIKMWGNVLLHCRSHIQENDRSKLMSCFSGWFEEWHWHRLVHHGQQRVRLIFIPVTTTLVSQYFENVVCWILFRQLSTPGKKNLSTMIASREWGLYGKIPNWRLAILTER